MKKFILGAAAALLCVASAQAQFFGVDTGKLSELFLGLKRLPYDNAKLLIGQTFKTLENDPKGYRTAVQMLDRMGNPADTLHNERLYLDGLQAVANSYVLSKNEKERPAALLALAQKNAVTTPATDLTLVGADGRQQQLLAGSNAMTLVFFNDMECDACAKAREAIAASATLRGYADSGLLRLVAVYTGNSEKAFKRASYPDWVTSTWDKAQQVERDDAYVLPTTPLFYLINTDGCVLVKNEPSLTHIEAALAAVMVSSDRSTATLSKLVYGK